MTDACTHQKVACPGDFRIRDIYNGVSWCITWSEMPELHDFVAQIDLTKTLKGYIRAAPGGHVGNGCNIPTQVTGTHLLFVGQVVHTLLVLARGNDCDLF